MKRVFLLLAIVSCSDPGGPAPAVPCGTLQPPCGGAILPGRYRVSACSLPSGDSSRQMPVFDTSGLTVGGTFTFNADGSYRDERTLAGRLVAIFPSKWASGSDLPFTCVQVGQVWQKETSTNLRARYASVSCSEAGELCSCVFTNYKAIQQATEGTYRLGGNDITLSWSASLWETRPYCAMGSAVTMAPRTGGLFDETTAFEPNLSLLLARE